MDDLKVLYALNFKDANAVIVSFIKNKMLSEMKAAGVGVGKIEMVRTKQQIEAMLDAEQYDLLITKEQLGEDKISSGSIKGWSQRYPNLKVILSVGTDKKGGEKLLRLLTSPPFYTNALYENDLTGENVGKLIREPRTKEVAIVYYGLEKRFVAEQEEAAAELKAEDAEKEVVTATPERAEEKPVIGNEAPTEEIKGVEAPVEEVPVSAQELEDLVAGFDDLEMEKMPDEVINQPVEEKAVEEPVKPQEEESVGFDFESMFSGKEFFAGAVSEPEVVFKASEEEEGVNKAVDLPVAEEVEVAPVEENKQEESVRMIQGLEDCFATKAEGVLPDEGKVLKVFDHNTMLVELSPVPVLPEDKTMEDYKIFFVVKGTRGGFVGGKYKVGVKSFEGYPGSLLGKQTVIVEVPEYDLVENKLEGASCGLIFIEQ